MVSFLKSKNYIIIYSPSWNPNLNEYVSFMEQRWFFFSNILPIYSMMKVNENCGYQPPKWQKKLNWSITNSYYDIRIVLRRRCERNKPKSFFIGNRSICFTKVNEKSSDLKNQSFDSDLYNESIDLVHKTSLNDSQISHSLIQSGHFDFNQSVSHKLLNFHFV